MKYLLRATLALVSAVSAAGAQTQPLNFVRTLSPKSATASVSAAVALPESDRITSTTYYNGLGWEVQSVATWAGPGNKDQVTLIGYDAQGRPTTQYLPYAVSNTGGNTLNYRSAAWASEQGTFYGTPPTGVPQSAHPFSVRVLEASPLGRLLEQGAPGTTWQPGSGRTVRMGYHVNVTSEVRAWSVDASTGATSTTEAYPPGTLFITQTRDENGNYTREYKNRGDRVILRRVQLGTDSTSVDYWAETYYIYDDFGRLRCVIQPEGVAQLRPTGWPASVTLTQTFLDTWCFQDRYDGFGRIIEQRVPGGGWVHTVYNSADLPILTQDANQRAKSPPEWSFVKYDYLRRPSLSGLMRTTATRATLQTQADAATVLFESVGSTPANGGYTWAAYPTLTDTTILSVTYYDHYDFDRNGTPDVAFTPQRAYPAAAWRNTQGQQTGSRTRVLGSTTFLRSWQFADERGRTIFAYSSHHLGGGDTVRTAYNFVGWTLKTRRYHRAAGKPDLVVSDSMLYDHTGRVTQTWHRINAFAAVQTAQLTYNELGQLIDKKLHKNGAIFQETIAQSFNIRGWLSAITSSRYTQSMRYDTGLDPQYNGNIAGITYQNQNDISREYRYRYDKLSRLLSARNPNGLYDERGISYDRNGNILSLSRTDNGTRLDSLAYTYTGNRLLKVNDRVSTASPNHFPANTANHGLTSHYTYDANGNLTADVNKGITSITYNHLNKPVRITLSSGSWIEYRYDAAGTKVSKTTNTANKTDYLGGIEYDANALKRISFSEGYAELLPNATYEYKYTIKDHLGNTRSLFSQDATTLQRNHYYAFGLSITSLNFSGAGAAWKYQYNGKEKQSDFGLNWLDYGFRFYDPVVARFPQLDPLAHDFVYLTPYQYASNDPIRNIDLDGLEGVSYTKQFNRLTSKEKVLIATNFRKIDKLEKNKAAAFSSTPENLMTNGSHNDQGDAFRHALFSALNTQSFGEDFARELGQAHEQIDDPKEAENQQQEVKMDLHNNEIGINIGLKLPDADIPTLSEAIMTEMESGNLIILSDPLNNKSKLVPSGDGKNPIRLQGSPGIPLPPQAPTPGQDVLRTPKPLFVPEIVTPVPATGPSAKKGGG